MAKSRPSNDISWIESILGNESEEGHDSHSH